LPEPARDLWRISNYADLKGRGGLRASGRWHTRGREVVYCSEEPTGALLEALVHIEVESLAELPKSYQLLRIVLPGRVAVEEAALSSLPPDWKRRTLLTRSIGDAWLAAGRTAALRVPSAVSPHAFNVLLNPALAVRNGIRVLSKSRFPFDTRLFKVVGAAPEASRPARRRG
jgi:RES domain-containing protein